MPQLPLPASPSSASPSFRAQSPRRAAPTGRSVYRAMARSYACWSTVLRFRANPSNLGCLLKSGIRELLARGKVSLFLSPTYFHSAEMSSSTPSGDQKTIRRFRSSLKHQGAKHGFPHRTRNFQRANGNSDPHAGGNGGVY